MSTRSRILIALLVLALGPLLAVGGWAFVMALRASPDAIQLRLARTTVDAAVEVRGRVFAETSALDSLAAALGAGVDSVRFAAIAALPLAERFPVLELVAVDGASVARRGDSAEGASACDADATVRLDVPLDGPDSMRLAGFVPAARLLDDSLASIGETRQVLADGTTGRPLYDPHCVAKGWTPSAEPPHSPAAWGFDLPGTSLTVVGFPGERWPLPFPERGLYALALALFLSLAAVGAFVILVRDLVRSLDVLTAAADRIGQGDFSPWLPPPTPDEVGRLAFAISTMAARLESLIVQNARHRQMAAVGELASHVSHEIRNPLSSIKLNLQSIEREVRAGGVPSDLAEVLQLCLREVQRLDGTVRGVLRLASSRPPALAPLSLHGLLRDAIETVRPQLAAHAIQAHARLDAERDTVHADVAQLRGVLVNLLLNARDAMPGGGRIDVWTELAEDRRGREVLRTHVADSGPGVPADDADRIFEPFFTTKPTGSGIGLPLAARSIEAHGGRLVLERSPASGRGAEFIVELPLARPTIRTESSAPLPKAGPPAESADAFAELQRTEG